MPLVVRRLASLLAQLVFASALIGAVGSGRDVRPSKSARPHAPPPPPATVHFADKDADDPPDSAFLDAIIGHAWSDQSALILVLGFANEESHLNGNLGLAERRARNVAARLLSRAVRDNQILIAATEAPADDPTGARCEVAVIRPAR
jgi:hypothetical protein